VKSPIQIFTFAVFVKNSNKRLYKHDAIGRISVYNKCTNDKKEVAAQIRASLGVFCGFAVSQISQNHKKHKKHPNYQMAEQLQKGGLHEMVLENCYDYGH
jgi:hypothetical protein